MWTLEEGFKEDEVPMEEDNPTLMIQESEFE
jgi:hypothetical protein